MSAELFYHITGLMGYIPVLILVFVVTWQYREIKDLDRQMDTHRRALLLLLKEDKDE